MTARKRTEATMFSSDATRKADACVWLGLEVRSNYTPLVRIGSHPQEARICSHLADADWQCWRRAKSYTIQLQSVMTPYPTFRLARPCKSSSQRRSSRERMHSGCAEKRFGYYDVHYACSSVFVENL